MASLQHDASGFLVGERLVNGIDLVGKDTTEILKILKSSIGLQQSSNNRLRVTLDRINNQSQLRVIDVTPTPLPVPRIGNNNQQLPTVDVGAPTSDVRPIPPTREYGHDYGQVDDTRPSNADNPRLTPNENANGSPTPPTPDIEPTFPHTPLDDGRRSNGRRRNAQGQFEGDSSNHEGNGLINGIKNAVRDGFELGNADTHNIDPTVDAVRELGELMSPLAKVGKTMFKGASWLFRRKKKREEPSDQEQRQQSRIEKLLKRIAGSRVGQAASSGVNLFGGLFSSLTGTAGSLLSGLGKVLTGAILPALGLTAAFKLGEWVGGKIYDAIGPAISDAVDWSVDAVKKAGDAYNAVIAKATSGIEASVEIYDNAVANTTDNIEKVANGAKGLWAGVKNIRQQAIDKLSGGMAYVADKLKPSKSINDNQVKVYNAFKSTGMGDAQAKAMTAEVGRENDYSDKYLYGTHTDDKNGVTNQGMFSWQKDRRAKLVDFMQKRGLVDKGGNFAKSQESLNAQAAFAKSEIDSGKYEKTRQFFANNPNANPDQAAQVLGRDYVGWRIDDPKYAPSGNAKRKGYADNLDKQLSMVTTTPLSMPIANKPSGFFNGGMTSTVSAKTFAPAIPTTVPKLLARPLPETPKVKQQVSTKDQPPMKVSVVDGGSTIGQNLSDRHLAHAVTGGLGMDALRTG